MVATTSGGVNLVFAYDEDDPIAALIAQQIKTLGHKSQSISVPILNGVPVALFVAPLEGTGLAMGHVCVSVARLMKIGLIPAWVTESTIPFYLGVNPRATSEEFARSFNDFVGLFTRWLRGYITTPFYWRINDSSCELASDPVMLAWWHTAKTRLGQDVISIMEGKTPPLGLPCVRKSYAGRSRSLYAEFI
jgi:hypothetical protein